MFRVRGLPSNSFKRKRRFRRCQDGFPGWGAALVSSLSPALLGWVYSIVYNGMYMIPEMVLTAVAAVILGRIPQLSRTAS